MLCIPMQAVNTIVPNLGTPNALLIVTTTDIVKVYSRESPARTGDCHVSLFKGQVLNVVRSRATGVGPVHCSLGLKVIQSNRVTTATTDSNVNSTIVNDPFHIIDGVGSLPKMARIQAEGPQCVAFIPLAIGRLLAPVEQKESVALTFWDEDMTIQLGAILLGNAVFVVRAHFAIVCIDSNSMGWGLGRLARSRPPDGKWSGPWAGRRDDRHGCRFRRR